MFAAEFLTERHFDTVLTESADVLTESGETLIRFRKDAIPEEHFINSLPALRKAAIWTGNPRLRLGRYGEGRKPKDENSGALWRDRIL